MKNQYIGIYEISSQEEIGNETVRVSFKPYKADNGNTYQPPVRDYTYKTFLLIVSDEPCDFTQLREKQYTGLVNDIFELMLSYDVNISTRPGSSDLDYIFQEVYRRVNDTRNQLEDKLWGAEEDEKTLRQLFSRWHEQKDTQIRKLELIHKPDKKK